MEKFTLTDHDDYLEDSILFDLSEIPDCKGKYDISTYPEGSVNTWDWLILFLEAKIITSINEDILADRYTDNQKYNFIWNEIIRTALKDNIDGIILFPNNTLWVKIYPTFISVYCNGENVRQRQKNIPLTVSQTVKLLESGVFTDIVDNSLKDKLI